MDEVGELPQAAQAKLLRVLESGEFRRIGGSAVQKTDVRIIAATNRNLKRMVVEKLFREDLYYRLNVVPVTIPPLRERLEDLEALACVFLNQFNHKHGKSRILSAQELVELKAYRWPGNIRELRNVMEPIRPDGRVLHLGERNRDPSGRAESPCRGVPKFAASIEANAAGDGVPLHPASSGAKRR